MQFAKMQGLGNDLICLNCMDGHEGDRAALAAPLCDRHFGVGGDGLLCICPSDGADFRMELYNADGSPAEMCGNGLRCLGKYVYDRGLTRKTALAVETPAGIRQISLCVRRGEVSEVTADMGAPELAPARRVAAAGGEWRLWPVRLGNPHAVLWVEDPAEIPVERLGPALGRHPAFPAGTNVEFAAVTGPGQLAARVWERGCGETLACGTGACAVLAAAVTGGLCGREAQVRLPGGTLYLSWPEAGPMYMTGPAVTVFEGQWPDRPRREGEGLW